MEDDILMGLTLFGIATLIAPFLFLGGAIWARKRQRRGLFIFLMVLTAFAVIVAAIVILTVGATAASRVYWQ